MYREIDIIYLGCSAAVMGGGARSPPGPLPDNSNSNNSDNSNNSNDSNNSHNCHNSNNHSSPAELRAKQTSKSKRHGPYLLDLGRLFCLQVGGRGRSGGPVGIAPAPPRYCCEHSAFCG